MENENEKSKKIAEKVGDLPVNSRIYINYKENPPKISFDYPDTNINQIRMSSTSFLFAFLATLIMIMIVGSVWVMFLNYYVYNDIDSGNITINKAEVWRFSANYSDPNSTKYGFSGIYVNYTWHGKERTAVLDVQKQGLLWYYPQFIQRKSLEIVYTIQGLIVYVIIIVLFIFNLWWVTKVFTKTHFGHKTFPEINKRLHDRKYSAEFFPQDVGDNKIVELPMFQNMYMDYEATGEFSKYLEKVSVVEHPFSKYVKKKGILMKDIRRKRKGAKHSSELDNLYDAKRNIYLWKTVFEFKEKPSNGTLRLWFT
jgi:hypothetical protein